MCRICRSSQNGSCDQPHCLDWIDGGSSWRLKAGSLTVTSRKGAKLRLNGLLTMVWKQPNNPCCYLSSIQLKTKGIFWLQLLNVAYRALSLHAYQKGLAGGLARLNQSRPTVAQITGRPNHTLISDVPALHWHYTWEEKIPHWGCEGIKWSALEDGAAGPGGLGAPVVCCQM